MTKKVLIYGFPFFLISLEAILRAALKLNSSVFVGPTLAGVGTSFLLPLIVPKQRCFSLSEQIQKELMEKKILLVSKSEQILIDFVWLFIFVLTATWVYVVYISCTNSDLTWGAIPVPLAVGLTNYFVGVLFSVLKEAV